MKGAKWLWALVLWLFTVAVIAGVSAALRRPWTPPGDPPRLGNRPDQCEALNLLPGSSSGIILEPQNTWSNSAYLLAGLLIVFYARQPLARALGAGSIVLAISSALYHATLQDNSSPAFDARTLDVAAMYAVLWLLLAYAVSCGFTHRRWSVPGEWTVSALLAVLAYGMARYRYNVWIFSSTPAVLSLIAATAVLCLWQMYRLRPPSARWYLLAFTIAGAAAATFRFGDGNGRWLCRPYAPIQPHAIWHVASAALLFLAYDFFAGTSPLGFTDAPFLPAQSLPKRKQENAGGS